VAAVLAVKLAVGAVVLGSGFRAVSDDDFARVVIAQRWAAEPGFDATGSSWLPLPFWLYGAAMAAFGRSLDTALALALVLGLAAAAVVYAAARLLAVGRSGALVGALVAAAFPWSAWLAVATVPEHWTAALAVLAIAAAAQGSARWRVVGGAALLVACLSRYEPWLVALGFAGLGLWDVRRGRNGKPVERALGLVSVVLALLGPALWLLHGALAHGDALHFAQRVADYRQALGGAAQGLSAALAYPLAVVEQEPELALAAALLAGAGAGRRWPTAREWRVIGLGALLVVGLSAAATLGGAPTHHPGRALLAVWLLLALFAGARASSSWRVGRLPARLGLLAAAFLVVAFGALVARPRWSEPTRFTSRAAETAIGTEVARLVPAGCSVLLEARDYGYFAVLAASGRPERFIVDRSVDPRREKASSSFASAESLMQRIQQSGVDYAVARASAATAELGSPLATANGWGLWRVRRQPSCGRGEAVDQPSSSPSSASQSRPAASR